MNDNVTYLHSGSAIPARDDRDWVTSQELLDEAQITYRQLDYWCRTDLLTAIDGSTPGTGYLRRFDAHEVTRARTVAALLSGGISLQFIRTHVDQFIADGHIPLGPFTLIDPARPTQETA